MYVCWLCNRPHRRHLQHVGSFGIHVSHDVIWLQQIFYKAKNAANYVEVNVKPEQNKTQMTVVADEDEESSHGSSNKSSESSENNSEYASENTSENALEDDPDDNNDANELDEPKPQEQDLEEPSIN
jgi:alpha-acetolactate decarboxylase